MTFKRFILLSIAVHVAVLFFIYFMPSPRHVKQRELFARLVTPESPAVSPPVRKRPLPVPPAQKNLPPKRIIPPPSRRRALPPVVKPVPPPPEARPTIPGEGSLPGKSLAPGKLSKEGKAGGEEAKGTAEGKEKSPKAAISPHGKSFDLFDRNVTEQIARRDDSNVAKREEGGKNTPITMDTKNYLYRGYLTMLRQKIESIWVYPPEAAAKGLYGDLQIRFTIKKDGTLADVDLVRTSGYQMLDAAAIKALRDGAPYWPLPDSWRKKEYTILGHFVYTMYGYRIQ